MSILNAVCAVHLLTSQLEQCGKDQNELYRSVMEPGSYFPEMIVRTARTIYCLDRSNPIAARLQGIWGQFYQTLTPPNLFAIKKNLREFVEQVRSADFLPMAHNPIVLVKQRCPFAPDNVLFADEVMQIQILCSEFMKLVDAHRIEGRVEDEVNELLRFKPGRELIRRIIVGLNQKNQRIEIKLGSDYKWVAQSITLAPERAVLVFECTGPIANQTVLKSLHSPKAISLAHELLHLLHHLEGKRQIATYPEESDERVLFTSPEERATICGTEQDPLCENSFFAAYGLPLRHGHIGGTIDSTPHLDLAVQKLTPQQMKEHYMKILCKIAEKVPGIVQFVGDNMREVFSKRNQDPTLSFEELRKKRGDALKLFESFPHLYYSHYLFAERLQVHFLNGVLRELQTNLAALSPDSAAASMVPGTS